MDYFEYRDGRLFAERVSLEDVAVQVGTPCYVYSRATLERHWKAFDRAFDDYPHRICYAVKANGNLAVLNLLTRMGSGFDIVSGGELLRVMQAGGEVEKVIFSGVGKQEWEIRKALEVGIDCFNIESEGELQRISGVAGSLNKQASVSVRINPDVDAKTHPYIATGLRDNKFGLAPDRAVEVYKQASADANIAISGVACHIGSQLTELEPYKDALNRVLDFVERLKENGVTVNHIDFGGGLGVRYHDEDPPSPLEYWEIIKEQLHIRGTRLPVTIEPGRAIIGNAGILLTRVEHLKRGEISNFCIVDAAMNDLIRPVLYHAYQEIIEVDKTVKVEEKIYDIVGPVCESSDFLGKKRKLCVEEKDLLAVRTSGAYAAVMSSNYNSRPRPAEVMVDGDKFYVVKERETLEALYRGEHLLPV